MKESFFHFLKINSRPRILHLAFALGICIIISQLNLDFFEGWTYNFRVKTQINPRTSNKIKILKLEDKKYPSFKDQIVLLKRVLAAKPDFVLYFMDLKKLKGPHRDQTEFVNLFNSYPEKLFFVNGRSDDDNFIKLKAPLNNIPIHNSYFTLDRLTFSKDSISRRMVLKYADNESLLLKIAKKYNKRSLNDYHGVFRHYSSWQGYFRYSQKGSFQEINFNQIQKLSINTFQNIIQKNIIFIGADNKNDTYDYASTPFSSSLVAFPRVLLQASFLNTLLNNSILIKSSKWLNYILIVFISFLTVFAVFTVKPLTGLYILFGTFISYSLIGYITFNAFNYWLEMAPAFLTIFLCYYFFIPYRLIKENKKSWEYQEHNKMLSKVEELKTNFMRMMSHDLKTPLARIQGLADVVAKGSSPLDKQQKDALGKIYKSSADLTVFIETILDLSRVESNEVKLHLQSKDLNTLLTQVIKKCEFLANQKNISIITEFEPLFSIKVDEGLLKQVFVNLIENAIKYSDENSRILVSSEEFDNQVIIQVADQGKGLKQDEKEHVFDKFYRSKSAQNSDNAGSGLGLYLSKYFVELHNGNIQVDSDENKGSTFTVNLPMNL